ncbi:hypothetical protein PR202_ga09749 [Eleusine coracana subsp. coracana]|uniref:3'-5' exonuclease domain-containing protein n=1 Tax=Eleusine coracana subsp. coracana TaxID=191504 RepID=A0AAV5C555_ELECO|nr:hypothetical protein QOZ80_1AG0032410 [Eleusine coracana subsp. coracana]GJM93205.1 hypothetical protein PR202_ga09749 [Eleusine coracana subsp. coracana]
MATRIEGFFKDGTYAVGIGDYVVGTVVTDEGGVVKRWINDIYRIHHRRLHRLIVGLDVEWRPPTPPPSSGIDADKAEADAAAAPRRPAAPAPPVAVLQLCVGPRCLVFHILHADYIPAALFDFLADDRFYFVGVGVHEDAAKLRAQYGLEVARPKDLRGLAAYKLGRQQLRAAGLPKLAWEVMGLHMHKPYQVRVSDWDARRLTQPQIMYACADAFVSFEVGRMLYDGEY